MKKLYIGNLRFSTNADQLRELFEQYGEVRSVQILIDRETHQSRGFGFVEMVNDGEALKAIEKVDGSDFDGRRLTVNEARPRAVGGYGRSRTSARGARGS